MSTYRDQWSSRKYTLLSILLLLFCGKSCSVINDVMYVKRLAGGEDRFGPVSSNVNYCSTKHATSSGQTDCTCLSKGTYLYYNDTCVQEQIITALVKPDCKVILNQNEILSLKKPSKQRLGTVSSKVKNIHGKCTVSQTLFIYDSKKELKLIQIEISHIFSINAAEKALKWSQLPAKSRLHGRIIVLQTRDCTLQFISNDKMQSPCIIFKAEGTIFYNSSSTVSTAMSTLQYSTMSLYSTVSSALPTTKLLVTSTKMQPIKYTTSVKSTIATSTPSAKPLTGASKPRGGEGHSDRQSAPVGLIAGLVVAIVVVLGVMILICVWRRRLTRPDRKKHKLENGQKHATHSDNPVYGQQETINPSNQNQPSRKTANEVKDTDYAAINSDPSASKGTTQGIYQSLIKDPNQESAYTPLERNDSSVEQSYEYNKVDRQPFKPVHKGPSDPTYIVLERPNKQKSQAPGNHTDKNKRPLSKHTPNEPVYNVLEGHNPESEDEHEYNNLETPEWEDDPNYIVLEDPDNNIDNAPHCSSHDNVGYGSTIDIKPKLGVQNEPVYEAPEGPSSDSTYQPLDVNAQDGSVYQPLDRTSKVIPDSQPIYQVLEQNT